jgi:predicted nucleic-acid-binding protein
MTADTNVLVRAATGDDARQSRVARDELARAEMVALTLPTLCELAWVLSRGYKIPADEISAGLRRLIDSANVVVNRPAAEAGLAHLDAGGDFADGVIAFEGASLGADTFVSFDKSAVTLALEQGMSARLLT